MEVVIALVSAVIGAVIAFFAFTKMTQEKPVGFLYVKDTELYLELSEPVETAIKGKKYVTMQVMPLDSSHD